MRLLSLCSFLFLASSSFGQQPVYYTSTKVVNPIEVKAGETIKFSYKVFDLGNKTYGYDILANGKIYFHQENKPGKEAGTGFSSEENAVKVAKMVISRLERPVMTSGISTAELKILNIQ